MTTEEIKQSPSQTLSEQLAFEAENAKREAQEARRKLEEAKKRLEQLRAQTREKKVEKILQKIHPHEGAPQAPMPDSCEEVEGVKPTNDEEQAVEVELTETAAAEEMEKVAEAVINDNVAGEQAVSEDKDEAIATEIEAMDPAVTAEADEGIMKEVPKEIEEMSESAPVEVEPEEEAPEEDIKTVEAELEEIPKEIEEVIDSPPVEVEPEEQAPERAMKTIKVEAEEIPKEMEEVIESVADGASDSKVGDSPISSETSVKVSEAAPAETENGIGTEDINEVTEEQVKSTEVKEESEINEPETNEPAEVEVQVAGIAPAETLDAKVEFVEHAADIAARISGETIDSVPEKTKHEERASSAEAESSPRPQAESISVSNVAEPEGEEEAAEADKEGKANEPQLVEDTRVETPITEEIPEAAKEIEVEYDIKAADDSAGKVARTTGKENEASPIKEEASEEPITVDCKPAEEPKDVAHDSVAFNKSERFFIEAQKASSEAAEAKRKLEEAKQRLSRFRVEETLARKEEPKAVVAEPEVTDKSEGVKTEQPGQSLGNEVQSEPKASEGKFVYASVAAFLHDITLFTSLLIDCTSPNFHCACFSYPPVATEPKAVLDAQIQDAARCGCVIC